MNAITAEHLNASREPGGSVSAHPLVVNLDPLEPDCFSDEIVLTTRRAICRIALVAAETGGRFQREALEFDPMSWMLAPRRVFDGAAALEACLDRQSCLRAIVVHGLGLGLDIERSAVDELLATDEDEDEHDFRSSSDDQTRGRGKAERGKSGRATRVRLYTATIIDARNNKMSQIFHASLARNVAEVRARLVGRFGHDVASLADIRLGLHVASPPVVGLVPDPVIELIRRMERDSAKPHARTFAVDIEMAIQA